MTLFVLFAFIAINTGIILTLWYREDYSMLRRFLFTIFLASILLTGDAIIVASCLSLNTGFMYLMAFYMIGFIFIHSHGHDYYITVLKDHFMALILIAASTFPLLYVITSDDVGVKLLWGSSMDIDNVLISRSNFIISISLVFYIGQLVYAHSFRLIERKSFWFEYLLRLPIFMSIQSALFYLVQILIINNYPEINKAILDLSNVIISGNISRYSILLLTAIPFYIVYNKRYNGNELQSTT